MKTLHLSIIVISIICLTYTIHPIEAQCYGCGQNSTALKQALLERQTQPIIVGTNLENYSTGDKIEISASIANPNNNTPLVIKILDPRNEEQFEKIFPLSLNQSYTWTVSTVDFWGFSDSGNYTVLSQYGQDYATTHFYLNSTLVQYLYAQSPLWQFKNGMPAQDIHCHSDLKLIIRAENSEPACVSQITATKLVLRGWALPPPPKEPYVNKMSIKGLQQSYVVGQPINATVTYSGYYWYVEPNVKIFDANGTQVWFNCPFCYARTESIQTPSFGTFAYLVREYSTNALPIINKTGTYTMTASFENKTADGDFTVTQSGNNTLPASFEPCQDPYPQNYKGIPVLSLPANSTGKICVRYHNLNDIPVRIGIGISEANNLTQDAKDVSTWNDSGNNTISAGDSTVVYWIKTGNHKGLYGLTIFCVPMPFAVGSDNSTLGKNNFPWIGQSTWFCPAQFYDFHIDSTTGIGVRYIPMK